MQRNSCICVLAGVVCALFSFGACAYSTNFQPRIEGDSNRESDRPELNSSPHHLLVLRGEKDPSIEVWLGVQFATTNGQCQSRSQFQSQINAHSATSLSETLFAYHLGRPITPYNFF
jgi:hypothetical protein